MESPLADRTSSCLSKYRRLAALISDSTRENDPSYSYITDTATRFRIWAANLGSFHPITDLKSADHRLKQAPAIVKHLEDILDELCETLDDIDDVIGGVRCDQSELPRGSSEISDDEELGTTSELRELCSSLPDLVTSLFKVSIFIRTNTTRDRYAKAAAASYDEFLPEFDIRHVADKFPKTESWPWLQVRLGNAITKRRQFLRYVRDHYDKIARPQFASQYLGMQMPQSRATIAAPDPSEQRESIQSSTAQTAASTLMKTHLTPETSYDVDEDVEDDQSYATSFVSSRASEEFSGKLEFARLQDMQKNGLEFECPYCRGIVRPKKNAVWKKHVFRDLRAYVCTFEDCTVGLFEDKQSWFRHELEHHRRQWICIVCSSQSFHSSSELRSHIRVRHNSEKSSLEMSRSMLEASSRPATEIAASACPLCNDWDAELRAEAGKKGLDIPTENYVMVPLEQFKKHLGSHQEQLALFAVTPTIHREVDSEDDSHKSRRSEEEQRHELLKWGNQVEQIDPIDTELPSRDPNLTEHAESDEYKLHGLRNIDRETKFSSFEVAQFTQGYFVPGRVFSVLAHEFEAERHTIVSEVDYGDVDSTDKYFNLETRRFVVVREGEKSCTALAIFPRTPTRPLSLEKSEYAIVFTGTKVPEATPAERADARRCRKTIPAIRVDADQAFEKLEEHARVDFTKLYTIPHNIKVKNFGRVHPDSLDFLYPVHDKSDTELHGPARRAAAESDSDEGLGPQVVQYPEARKAGRHPYLQRRNAISS